MTQQESEGLCIAEFEKLLMTSLQEMSGLHKAISTNYALSKQINHEKEEEELTLFTCLIDMVALEEGLFSACSPYRLQLAWNHLRHGLWVPDGSVFKYSSTDGPTVTYGATEDETKGTKLK